MAHVIEACNSIYTFKVKYFFVVSSGWHTVRYPFIGAPSHTNQYYEAQSIEITVNGLLSQKMNSKLCRVEVIAAALKRSNCKQMN